MMLSVEIWCFGYSETSVMSDLIQSIQKTNQVRFRLHIRCVHDCMNRPKIEFISQMNCSHKTVSQILKEGIW